jgi:hypothetical protein
MNHNITVSGSNYEGSRRVTITLSQGGAYQNLTNSLPVAANGTFTFTDQVATGFNPGTGTLTVCYVGGSGCRSESLTLTH